MTTTTIAGAANDAETYLVRVRIDGVRTDFPCERDGAPPPPNSPCEATVVGNDMVLSWDAAFDDVNIRRNGSWLVTAPDGAASYTVPGGANDAFVIVIRPGGVKTTHPCV